MIFNLVELFSITFPTFNFVANGWQVGSANDSIAVSEGGGDADMQIDRKDFFIQLMSRAQDKTIAKSRLLDAFNLIQKKFGLILPAAEVGSDKFPAVKTWKIVALQLPGFIGNDENGRALFSVNFNITTE